MLRASILKKKDKTEDKKEKQKKDKKQVKKTKATVKPHFDHLFFSPSLSLLMSVTAAMHSVL